MNILFVSSALDFDNSSASHRNRALLKRLAITHNVDSLEIVGKMKRYYSSPVRRELQVFLPGYRTSVDVNQVKSNRFNFKKYLKYIIPDKLVISLPFFKLNLSGNLDDKYDFIILSSDPKGIFSILFNAKFRRISNKAKIIQYWGDPLVGDVNYKYHSVFHSLLEKIYLYCADKVLFVSSATMEAKRTEYPKLGEKFGYLPRCVDYKNCGTKVNVGNSNVLRLLYSGEYHSDVRNINPLLKAVQGSAKMELTVVGTGCHEQNIKSDSISFMGRIPKKDLDFHIDNSDLLIVILNSRGTQIPGKIFDLVFSDQVVLVLYESKKIIEHIPFKNKFFFVENSEEAIKEFLGTRYQSKSISYDEFDFYDRQINYILNNLFL